jgi:protein phosphatase
MGTQVTHDHTVVAGLLEAGQLTADEATLTLRPGDRLVLTTDGVHSHVDHVPSLLLTRSSAQEVADAVAAAVVAAGDPDSHTVVVVDLI